VLSPWSFIEHNESARSGLLDTDWDFVIVDEAHHLNLGLDAQNDLDTALTQIISEKSRAASADRDTGAVRDRQSLLAATTP
jgi:Rad3-related DNA helicase